MGWRGRVSADGTTERGKRRAKWYPREGSGVPCQRDTGNFLPRVRFFAGKRDVAFEKSLDNKRDNDQSTGFVKEYIYVNTCRICIAKIDNLSNIYIYVGQFNFEVTIDIEREE